MYETNVASIRIWEALGFKRIGRVKGAGHLRSSPYGLVDAIIYGRDLGSESADFVSDERFEKIRFYLKHGKYPNGADRAEKSRLRSAATHYKLVPAEDEDDRASGRDTERLMLKDKEVVADAQRQYEIAQRVHAHQHAGINKSTAIITEKYHWVRIKETVSQVIKNCPWCKDPSKPHTVRPAGDSGSIIGSSGPLAAPGVVGTLAGSGRGGRRTTNGGITTTGPIDPNSMIERMVHFENPQIAARGGSGNGRTDPRFHNRREGGPAAAAAGGGGQQQMQEVRNHRFDYHELSGPIPVSSISTGISNINTSGGGGLQLYPDIPVDPRIMPPHLQPHGPPLQDVGSDMLGPGSGGLMRSGTLIAPAPASVNAAHIMAPLTPNPFPPDPRTVPTTTTTASSAAAATTTTTTPSSPILLFDPHHNPAEHHHRYINPHDHNDSNNNTNISNNSETNNDADFEPIPIPMSVPVPADLLLPHPPLLMHPQHHHHHQNHLQLQHHQPHEQILHAVDEDHNMDFDADADADVDPDGDEHNLDDVVDDDNDDGGAFDHLDLRVHDVEHGVEDEDVDVEEDVF